MPPPPDPASILARLATFAAAAGDSRDLPAVFHAAAAAAHACIGHRLFTVMRCDLDTLEVQRLFSSNPRAYPPGGRKKKQHSRWGDQVLIQGQPFIGRTADDIREHFADHELILGLGLESVLNMPVRCAGRTVGTVNLLHEAGFYTAGHLPTAQLLATLLAGPLLTQAVTENDA